MKNVFAALATVLIAATTAIVVFTLVKTPIEIKPTSIYVAFCAIMVLPTLFWLWMLVDCALHEPSKGNDKIVWILVIILVQFIGALLYFVFRRPKRKKVTGN